MKSYKYAFVAALSLALLGSAGFVQATGYGGHGHGQDKETVCKPTGSRFNPYVKITVPEHVAEQILAHGGVLPNSQGKCPQGISLRDFIREKEHQVAQRWGNFFHGFGHFSFNFRGDDRHDR